MYPNIIISTLINIKSERNILHPFFFTLSSKSCTYFALTYISIQKPVFVLILAVQQVNRLYVHIHPLTLGPPSHRTFIPTVLGQQRALS